MHYDRLKQCTTVLTTLLQVALDMRKFRKLTQSNFIGFLVRVNKEEAPINLYQSVYFAYILFLCGNLLTSKMTT